MNIDHEFTVPAPADRAWAMLTDFEQVASCMPGARLTGEEDGRWLGVVKVKVGPVTASYKGSASFAERDDAGHHAVIAAKGREARGSGTATATIDLRLRPEGEAATVVTVSTDLKISGKIAQFGSGMIQEVSTKLLRQFTQCLEGRITEPAPSAEDAAEDAAGTPEAGGDAGAGESGTGESGTGESGTGLGTRPVAAVAAEGPGGTVTPIAGTTAPVEAVPPRPTLVAVPAAEPAAVDLVGVVGPALLKRVAPVLAGAAVLVALVRLLRALRRS